MPSGLDSLLDRLADLVPAMHARAPALDAAAVFPDDDIAELAATGLLQAPFPVEAGGLGLGATPDGAAGLLAVLRSLGLGNMALGRLFEAHVNAVRLLVRYGDATVIDEAVFDAESGRLIGLWVTDPPGGGLFVEPNGALRGAKQFCSGAGHVSRAVVTAVDEAGQVRLAYAQLEAGVTTTPLPGSLAGMRAAATGQATFDGAAGLLFGVAGDYLREPDFSCGAWRTAAVTLGGLHALVEQYRCQLAGRGRSSDPHQQARFGHALIAAETARLWLAQAADLAEAADAGPAAIAYVGLARLAVERSCLDVIELAQRSLGVAALQRGNPVERLCRDLATYLRQPAADMVLTEAAALALAQA